MITGGGRFASGSVVVEVQRWRGLLWAARPATVVADDGNQLLTWSPAGTRGCFATSRFYEGREHLSRGERQLVSLETARWHYRGADSRASSLTFLAKGAWSSIAVTWLPSGEFLHWYVNFQVPLTRTARGYETLDLVLDVVVQPDGTWRWKDQADFAEACHRGIFSDDIARRLEDEHARVQDLLAARTGPFEARWITWRPPPSWDPPELTPDFAEGVPTPPGAVVTLAESPIVVSLADDDAGIIDGRAGGRAP